VEVNFSRGRVGLPGEIGGKTRVQRGRKRGKLALGMRSAARLAIHQKSLTNDDQSLKKRQHVDLSERGRQRGAGLSQEISYRGEEREGGEMPGDHAVGGGGAAEGDYV